MRSVYADSASRTRPSRITRARLSPTPSTACRSVALAPKRAWSVPKCSISRSAEIGRQAVDLRHLPEAAGRDVSFPGARCAGSRRPVRQ